MGGGRGAVAAVLSEHHGTDDRHLPSPVVLAAAIAARTETLPIMVAWEELPVYEPVRLAEDIAALDIISRGRVAYVLGVGHRPQSTKTSGLSSGGAEPGRMTSSPCSRARPRREVSGRPNTRVIPTHQRRTEALIGGGSLVAGRRAGRFGLGLIAQAATPGRREAYQQACQEAGHEPGFVQIPEPGSVMVMFVADDVESLG